MNVLNLLLLATGDAMVACAVSMAKGTCNGLHEVETTNYNRTLREVNITLSIASYFPQSPAMPTLTITIILSVLFIQYKRI